MTASRTACAALVLAAMLVAHPHPSVAGFPGRNGRIAFSGFAQIFTIRPDGTGLRKLTAGDERSGSPTWSPDGDTIAFTCGGGVRAWAERREICTMDARGRNITTLTDNDLGEQAPAWSPDATMIAFERGCYRGCVPQIWTMASDGSNEIQITNGADGSFSPAWSPDGASIAFMRDCDIYVMDARGGGEVNLTSRYATATEDPCEMAPAWSPDGTAIAYMCLSDTQPYCGNNRWNVWVMAADGSDPRQVTSDKKRGGAAPEWSPNGRRICFNGGRYDQISTIRPDGSGLRRVTDSTSARYGCSWQSR